MGDIGEPRGEFDVLPTRDLDQAEEIAAVLTVPAPPTQPMPAPPKPESRPPAR